jgi:hypothetical protein
VPFTFRIKLPSDFKIPAHSHPAIEHVTVISGTFNIGMGDKLDPSKTQAIPAGGVAIMQPKMNHFAWTKEETIVQVHGVGPWAVNYVDPADDAACARAPCNSSRVLGRRPVLVRSQ